MMASRECTSASQREFGVISNIGLIDTFNPPGTNSNTKMRLKGHGLPIGNGKTRGDEYVRIIVDIPPVINKKQKALIEELAKEGM